MTAKVLEIYGGYKLDYPNNIIATWDVDWDEPFDEYTYQELWDLTEVYYHSYYVVGIKKTVAFRIIKTGGAYLDFEMSACIHLWIQPYFREVSWNLTGSEGGSLELVLYDSSAALETISISYPPLVGA